MKKVLLLGIALVLLGVAGLIVQAAPSGQSPIELLEPLFSPPLSQSAYEQLYEQAKQAKNAGQMQEATAQFKRLKSQQHGLQPLVLVSLSKLYAQQNQEAAVRSALQKLLKITATSPYWQSLGNYLLGQSYYRASEFIDAKNAFELSIKAFDLHQAATASHYYLGELALKENNNPEAINHFRHYLANSPEGTLGSAAATALKKLGPNSNDFGLIAISYTQQDEAKKALPLFSKAPFKQVWFNWATAYARTKQYNACSATIVKGLPYAQSPEEAEAAIELLEKTAPNKAATLKALAKSTSIKHGKDTLLWRLAQMSSGAEQTQWQQQLIKYYPNSRWAPETNWQLIWPDYLNGKTKQFIQKATAHTQRYANSRSAPKALFWLGKAKQKLNSPLQANGHFKQLALNYSGNYYAYRATQLVNGQQYGWQLSDTPLCASNSQNTDSSTLTSIVLNALEKTDAILKNDAILQQSLKAAADAQQWNDIDLILSYLPKPVTNPLITALEADKQNNHFAAIKAFGQYVQQAYKQGNTTVLATLPPQLAQLVYPLEHLEQVTQAAQKANIPTSMAYGIIRQESAFNPLAISTSNALGLMQLLPSTAKEVAKQHNINIGSGSNAEIMMVDQNIQLGTSYLGDLVKRFSGKQMLAVGAYNGGPGAMGRWVAKFKPTDWDVFIEQIPYEQTRDYVKSVFEHAWHYQQLYQQH